MKQDGNSVDIIMKQKRTNIFINKFVHKPRRNNNKISILNSDLESVSNYKIISPKNVKLEKTYKLGNLSNSKIRLYTIKNKNKVYLYLLMFWIILLI